MRSKLNEWWQQRKEHGEAETDETEALEMAEGAELDAIIYRAQHTCIEARKECDRFYDEANKHAQAAQEHERNARRANDRYKEMARQGLNDRAAAAAKEAAEAWRATEAEARKVEGAWRAAGAEAWKAVGAMAECGYVAILATKRVQDYAACKKGKEREGAALRIKAVQVFEKSVKDQAVAQADMDRTTFGECSSNGAAAAAWAAAAACAATSLENERSWM